MKTAVQILAPLLILVSLLSWALASPVGASPDDDFHLASIWCAEGVRDTLCANGPTPAERTIPKSIATSACYAFKPNQSASCQGTSFGSASGGTISTDRGNWRGDYPPVFYAAMGLFADSDIATSVIFMRALNSLLFLGITTSLFALLPRSRRTALVWGFAISIVPLGMFLIPSTNPSSWAVISAGTLWLALLGYFETSGWRKTALGGIAVLSTVIGAGARADSAIYSLVAIAAVVVLTATRARRFLLSLILPIGLALIALLLYSSANQSSFASSGIRGGSNPLGTNNWKYYLFVDILNVPRLWAGVFGARELGWLDTVLPDVVWVSAIAVFSALAFAGITRLNWRKALALVGILASLWLIPTYILVQSQALVGEVVQPRYILPLIILLAGVALLQTSGWKLSLGRVQVIVIVAALAVANSVALHFNIRRYVTGVDVSGWNLDSRVEWWWAIPLSPMGVWALGTLAFAAALALFSPRLLASGTSATARADSTDMLDGPFVQRTMGTPGSQPRTLDSRVFTGTREEKSE